VSYAITIVLQELDKYAQNTTIDIEQLGIDPTLIDRVADPERLLQDGFAEMITEANLSQLLQSVESAFGTVAVLGVAAIHLFVMLAMAFYLLREDHRLARWFVRHFDDDRGTVRAFATAVDRDFNSIFFGNILNAILTGTIGVIAYSVLNVFAPPGTAIPAPALVGMLAGIASLIPVVGMKLVYFPVALLLLAQSLLAGTAGGLAFVIAFAVVSFVIVDTIPDLVLRPYVSGRSLHVGALMLAYTLGPLLFGWYGIFLMPMLLVFVVHFARIVLPELVDGSPIEPYAVDPGYVTVESGPDVAGEGVSGESGAAPDDSPGSAADQG